MHLAMPRKTSHPPPYGRSLHSSPIRRKQLQLGATIACGALVLIYLLYRLYFDPAEKAPPGTPDVVIVTLLDQDHMSEDYISKIKENRQDYEDRHGKLNNPYARFS